MPALNQVMIMGNLGADPEMRYTPQGTAVANFRVAINESYTDRQTGERQQTTEWVSVECWERLAETVNTYLLKGSAVFVQGALKTQSWDDKDTGEKRYKTFIRAKSVQFLDTKNGNGNNEQEQPARQPARQPAPARQSARQPAPARQPATDDDIPF
jgi:single-strand DNA-binding protein